MASTENHWFGDGEEDTLIYLSPQRTRMAPKLWLKTWYGMAKTGVFSLLPLALLESLLLYFRQSRFFTSPAEVLQALVFLAGLMVWTALFLGTALFLFASALDMLLKLFFRVFSLSPEQRRNFICWMLALSLPWAGSKICLLFYGRISHVVQSLVKYDALFFQYYWMLWAFLIYPMYLYANKLLEAEGETGRGFGKPDFFPKTSLRLMLLILSFPLLLGQIIGRKKIDSRNIAFREVLICLLLALPLACLLFTYTLVERQSFGVKESFVVALCLVLFSAGLLFADVVKADDGKNRFRFFGNVSAAVCLLPALMVFFNFGFSQNSRRMVCQYAECGRATLYYLMSAADFDGDGYSCCFGGLDARDASAEISPQFGDMKNVKPQSGEIPTLKHFVNGNKENQDPGYNIIFITIDTLRADRMPWAGYHRDLMPHLGAFAKDAIVFTRAYSHGNSTEVSLNSMFPVRYLFAPSSHQTLGFDLKAYHPKSEFKMISGDLALLFEGRYDKTVESLRKHLERNRGERFFAWLHLLYPHNPYDYREGVETFGLAPADRYDHEVKFTDGKLREAFSLLDEFNLREDSIIAIVADHGEEFGEHDYYYHSLNLYETLLRVPMLLYVPTLPPKTIDCPVESIGLWPTIAEILNWKVEGDSPNFMPLIRGESKEWGRPVFSRALAFDRWSIIEDEWKLIWDRQYNFMELYDLKTDPAETRNLADKEEGKRKSLQRKMAGIFQAGAKHKK